MQLNRTSIRDALGQEQSRVQIKQGKWQAGQSWHPCNITELIHVLMMSLVTPFRKTATWLSTSRTWAFGEQGEQGCSARGTWAGSPGDPSTGTPHRGDTAKHRQAEPGAHNGASVNPRSVREWTRGAARSTKWQTLFSDTEKKFKCTRENKQIIKLSSQEKRKVKLQKSNSILVSVKDASKAVDFFPREMTSILS